MLAARKAADAALARDQARAQAAARERGPVRNVTDPGSRIMTTATGGFMQGYNAQNLVTADGIIIATTLTSDANDVAWLGPMLAAAEEAAALIAAHRPPARPGEPGGADQASQASTDQASQASTDQASQASTDQASQASTDQASQASTDQASADQAGGGQYQGLIGLVLADAGYLSARNLALPGPDRLIATGKHVEKYPRSEKSATPDSVTSACGSGRSRRCVA